jgi:hypothetical protein
MKLSQRCRSRNIKSNLFVKVFKGPGAFSKASKPVARQVFAGQNESFKLLKRFKMDGLLFGVGMVSGIL